MKRKRLYFIGGIVLAITFLAGIVFAATSTQNNKNYAIDVIDDGSSTTIGDANIESQTKIVDAQDTEITLETSIKNPTVAKKSEIAIVIDSSYSMETNSEGYNIKDTATKIANNIFNQVADSRVAVVDNTGVKRGLEKTSDYVVKAINDISNNNGNDISDGLNYAKTVFTQGDSVNKYVIVITDATDNAKVKLEDLSTNGIKVYSILTDITSTAFGNVENPVPQDGNVYMLNEFNEQDISDNINKIIKNISINSVFNEDILRSANRGNFTLEILNDETDGTAVQNSDGSLNWNVDSLKVGENKKVKYKLKLNTNATIGTDFFYNDINVIKSLKLKYKAFDQDTENEISENNTKPTIQICDAYDLEIKAVGKDTDIPGNGAKFDITGVDEKGNVVLQKTDLTTDKNGNITINTIKKLGKVNYTIIPHIENLIGYEETSPVEALVDNQYTNEGGKLIVSYIDTDKVTTNDSNGSRKVTLNVPIELQKFKFKLDVSDLSDSDTKLSGIDFRLIQPKLNNIYEMDVLYGTTDNEGKIEFDASIMSTAGTYEYILSQMSDKDGYENVGNATIKVTFDANGKVVDGGVKVIYNSNIEGYRNSEEEVLLKIKEKCNSSSIFNMNINLTDEQTKSPIEGAIYDVTVTKINNSNTANDTMTYTKVTDSNGNIDFKSIASESGYTKIVIHENTPNNAYVKSNTDKEIIINRQGGIIQEITTGGDYTIKDPDNNNGIIVNLTSKKKNELNTIRVHLTEKNDTDLNLINVPIELSVLDGNVFKMVKTLKTDNDGYSEFTLEDPSTIKDGTYYYQIKTNPLPAGYYEPENIATIRVSVLNGRVADVTDVTDNDGKYLAIINPGILNENKDTTINNIAYVDYALTANANDTAYVKIKLMDADNNTPISNGKYEITMERDGAQIANAGSTGKYTNANGYTNKMSIPGLDTNPVTITIAQVYDATRQNGYKVDTKIYKIIVHKKADGNIQIDSCTLNDGTELPLQVSATYEDNNGDDILDTVVLNHINTLINPEDVILDFTVLKYDYVTKLPDQSQDLIVWSNDFKIFDVSTGEYEDFGKDNPYNPFITGVNTGNSYSPGQINIKIKPKNLPKVEDTNKDGFPTGGAVLHIGEYNNETGKLIEGTEYQIQINFTYSKETGTYKYSGYSNLSNWNLLKDFHHSTSKNTGEGYVESAALELWSNYGETANFGIDLSKFNYLGQELPGAVYDVKVALPTGKYITLTQDVFNGDGNVEIPNLYVKEGTIITITERIAPIGYEVDNQEMSFKIDSIDKNTGMITISAYGVKNDRITLDGNKIEINNDGEAKFIQKIKLVDLEKNNTKFGITTKDKLTTDPTEENSFKIVTNTGSSAISKKTNKEGNVTTLIGGEKKRDYMEYTISQKLSDGTQVKQFYKRLLDDIHVKVYFDDNGNIDNDPTSPNYYGTLCKSVDSNYGITWYIDSVNSDNRINVVLLQEKEDPLNINFKTVDSFTGATLISTAKYAVTPTYELAGEGETHTQVGYVDPNKSVTYTLKSYINENYVSIVDQEFTVQYDEDGNVSSVETAPNSEHITTQKNSDDSQTIDITVSIEPAVPFAINTKDYYTDMNLQNATYEVEREDGVLSNTKESDSEGNAIVFDGDFGTGTSSADKEYIYIVRQKTATYTYATVEEFKVAVKYNSNREIVGARLYEQTTSTNKFVTVSYKQPSEQTDIGYNGNNKGIVKIEIKNYPAFNMEITNVDRVNNALKVQGAKYKITSSVLKYPISSTEQITTQTKGTDINGLEMAYVDRTTFGRTETYEIVNTESASEYQKIRDTIKIEVDFDSNGYVNIANGNPVRVIEGNAYAQVSWIDPATTNSENFGIKIIIKSSPTFRINLNNIDRKDYNLGKTTDILGAEYDIASDYDTSAKLVKTLPGATVVMLGETPINGYVTYTIKETKAAVGYQTIEKDVLMKVHFDINGCIDNVEFTDSKNYSYAKADKIGQIVNTKDYFTIDLNIMNNPLIALDLNKINSDKDGLSNVEFHIEGKIKNTEEVIYSQDVTTISGLGAFRIDRALDNTTIIYTISETKNTVGYEYIPSELTIEVTYDNEGRILKQNNKYEVQLTPQVNWANIVDTEDYGIKLDVINERIKEIGINLNTIDKYDESKKAEKAEIKAYFTKDNATYNEDENHSTQLITGRDSDNDGTPDFAHGQDYQTLGKAENIVKDEIEGIQTATLVLKEVNTPNSYYDVNSKVSKDNIYMSWNYYSLSSIRIDMTFTDEGKIATANLRTDSIGMTPLGKLLDSKYVSIAIDKTNPYMLNIDLRYYPMLEMTINATSDDTYSRAADNNDNELIGTYRVAPQHYDDWVSIYRDYNTNLKNGLVTAGYIGDSQLGGLVPEVKTKDSKVISKDTNTYEANTFGLWTGEQFDINNTEDTKNNGRIRYVYIFEPNNEAKSEPANNYEGYEQLQYQQHGQQDKSPMYMSYNNALIGAIQVKYNEKGEVIETKILDDKGADSDNRKEQGDNSKYITAEISDNKHGVVVKVQYKRTTTIETKVIDNVTGAELKNIRLYPFKGGTINTNKNYTYDTRGYRNLSDGENTWTYWGGNDSNGDRRYVIGTEFRNSTMYNGYDIIGDIQLDIHYDEYGYVDINKSRVLSTNANGDPNAVIEKVDKDKIYLNIIANRKFDLQIDKKDKLDPSKTLTDAKFAIKSTKTDIKDSKGNRVNTKNDISQGTRTQVGLVHKGETVTYTVTETFTPEGYYTIDSFDMDVVFDENGVISKIILEDGTVLYDIFGIHESKNIPIKLISVADRYKDLKPQNITDLRFEIKNTPKFITNITLRDEFYRNEPIEGVTYSITNNTYGISADGNPITDANGKISTAVGTEYPNDTVRYTIKQTNIASGYYGKNQDIIVDVTFDDNGYVSDYKVRQGNDEQVEISTTQNKRGFDFVIYNKPKDVRIGIEKYDQLTNEKLPGVEFNISRQEVLSQGISQYTRETSATGNITEAVDTFDNEKEVLYTISETKQLDAYRRIEDIIIRVKYDKDGKVSYTNIDSNPSNVNIYIANNNFERLANGDKVHIKLGIPNDDTYDVIVKDEDKNVKNLGIENTLYDISINGIKLQEPEVKEQNLTTNKNGLVYVRNRKENGDINIKVSEEKIGEGYRENVSNSVELNFVKGISTYSLDLDVNSVANKGYTLISGPDSTYDTNYKNGKLYTIQLNNTNNTEVIVGIYEDTGKITFNFKNEAKSMINLRKIDAQSGKLLEGAEFEITSQEVDSFGNEQGTANTITSSIITNEEGKAYIDLGIRPQNKKIKYTFKEITAPNGYIAIEDVELICTYDANGKISDKTSNSKRIRTDDSWYDINATIKNGDLETYSVKIVSVDSRKGSTETGMSNNRINGSKFDITVKDSSGTTLAQVNNRNTDRLPDSFGYEEDGVITINGLKAEGTISVNVNQTSITEGFIRGDNQTAGVITFDNNYVKQSTVSKPEVSLSNLNYGGFIDSYIDQNENQIVIKVYNDPQVKLNLHKEDIDTGTPIEGATFTITSEIDGQNKVATAPTDLNVTTKGTDKDGNELVTIGAPEYGKTVIYTIKENKLKDYDQLDDIKIKVIYNTSGKINDWEILSDESYTQVKESLLKIDDQETWKTYTQEELKKLQDEKHKIEYVPTKDTRKLNTLVKNKASERIIPYTVIVEVQDEFRNPVKGIGIEFKMVQGKGNTPIYPKKETDDKGQTTYTADGSDRIEMNINITDSKSYTFNDSLNCIIHKNSRTGYIDITQNNNIYPEVDNINHVIKLVILGETPSNKYNINIMKMDKATNTTIVNNRAIFTVNRLVEVENDTDADQSYIEETIASNVQTNDSGLANIPMLSMPSQVGTYTYRIYEEESPTGYKKLNNPIDIDVTFDNGSSGDMIITDVVSKDKDNLYVVKKTENGFIIAVNNSEKVPDDQYGLNVYKVDEETGDRLNGALFKVKLPDANNTVVYTESGENTDNVGQLDYCYIGQDKDNGIRLKQMKRPSVEEVKESENGVLTQTYTFQEIVSPEGYVLDKEEINLNIEFVIDSNTDGSEFVKIKNVSSSNTQLMQIKDIQEDQIIAEIQNKKKLNLYTVHYDTNNMSNVTNMPADQVKTENIDLSIDANAPIAEGYNFKGWNTKADGTGKTYNPNDIYNLNEDVILYAQWNYIIKYDANAPVNDKGIEIGSTPLNIPSDQYEELDNEAIIDDSSIYAQLPMIEGYKFKEWNTKADGTGQSYKQDDLYKDKKGITLYAIWQYEITYDENKPLDENGNEIQANVSNMPSNPQVEIATSKAGTASAIVASTKTNPEVPSIDVEKYVFKEWNTKADGTGESYNPNDIYTGNKNITFYAIWELSKKPEDDLYLKSQKYKIGENNFGEYDDGDIYLYRVSPNTKLSDFIANCETNGKITVYKQDGNILGDSELVGTGMTLVDEKDGKTIRLEIGVTGDLDGNGESDITDLVKVRRNIQGIETHTGIYAKAGDINEDNSIDITDLVRIRRHIQEIEYII